MLFNLISWFAPSQQDCPVCGRNASQASSPIVVPVKHAEPRRILTSLCGTCRKSIPWITHAICRICGRAESCEDCIRRQNRYYALSRCAVRYDPQMRDWLALYKYRGNEGLEAVLSAMLAFAYERLCEVTPSGFDVITSVPLAPERLRARGYNQAERLAIRLAEWYGLEYRPMLLRLRHTEKQSLKTRRSRVVDMRGNFAAVPTDLVSGTVLLVDDIYTTGSTLDECARVLTQAFPEASREVYGLLWARS
ncbi:ComF family protein [Cohnella mopanensis]|uniref:ComF family protein n=1 Tax=Cohnella mopanensis TaxID=2911966 RepID=UPI001EF8AC78|nr:ComF family protein [Cohnella mopanensis]